MKQIKDLEIAKEFISKYISKDKPELVLITGSRIFGINDTDFDLCIIAKYPSKFLRKYSNFTAVEKYPKFYKGIRFEVELANWEYIEKSFKDITNFKAWHFNNASILFDKNNKFKRLKQKYKMSKKEIKSSVFRLFEEAYDNLEDAKKSDKKAYKTTTLLHLTESMNKLLMTLYLIKGKSIPTLKWRIYFLKKLGINKLNEKTLFNLNILKVSLLLNYVKTLTLKNKILTTKDIKVIYGE